MTVIPIAEDIEPVDWPVADEQAALLDGQALELRSEHTLIELGLIELENLQQLQRTVIEDLGRSTVLDDEVPSHEELEEAAERQELQSRSF